MTGIVQGRSTCDTCRLPFDAVSKDRCAWLCCRRHFEGQQCMYHTWQVIICVVVACRPCLLHIACDNLNLDPQTSTTTNHLYCLFPPPPPSRPPATHTIVVWDGVCVTKHVGGAKLVRTGIRRDEASVVYKNTCKSTACPHWLLY